jgi:hypothetical protein
MFAYIIDDEIKQKELDEIYVDIINTYIQYKTVSIIIKENIRLN